MLIKTLLPYAHDLNPYIGTLNTKMELCGGGWTFGPNVGDGALIMGESLLPGP